MWLFNCEAYGIYTFQLNSLTGPLTSNMTIITDFNFVPPICIVINHCNDIVNNILPCPSTLIHASFSTAISHQECRY